MAKSVDTGYDLSKTYYTQRCFNEGDAADQLKGARRFLKENPQVILSHMIVNSHYDDLAEKTVYETILTYEGAL